MKLFISQPMNGLTDDDIKTKREEIIKKVQEDFNDSTIEVIDSFIETAPPDAKPLWYLGKSLEFLSNADIVYFTKGWDKARGCKIEHLCAVVYGIKNIITE